MTDYKCPDCDCTTINDYDCEDCSGSQQDADGEPCELCNGDGYMAGVMECSECGIVDHESSFMEDAQ